MDTDAIVGMYLRISLDKTGEALGTDRQRAEALRQLEYHRIGGRVEEYLEPGSLSASKKRPPHSQYARLYRDAQAGKIKVLIVWDIDRLTRIPREIEDWLDLCERDGLRIITMDGECDTASANGRMFLRIKAAVARHEVEHKSARQKSSHRQRAEDGKPWWTTRPFGFNPDGTHHEVEAKIVRKLYRGILAERTLSDLTRWLNDQAIRSSRGNQWTSAHLRVLLLAPRNAGIRVRNGVEVGPGNWKPIIPEEQFRAVEHILKDEARYKGGGGPRKGLLVSVALCGACGATVRQGAVGRRRADGEYRKAYICVANGCVSHTIDLVDDAVGALLVTRFRDPDFLEPLLPKSESMDDLRAEKSALKEAMDQLGEDYADGLIARPEFRKLRERQNRSMRLIDERMAIATQATKLSKLPPLDVLARDWFKDDAVPVEVKRLAIETFMTVTLKVRGKGCRTWDAERDLGIEWVESLEEDSESLLAE